MDYNPGEYIMNMHDNVNEDFDAVQLSPPDSTEGYLFSNESPDNNKENILDLSPNYDKSHKLSKSIIVTTAVETAVLQHQFTGRHSKGKIIPEKGDDSASEKFNLIDDKLEYQENLLEIHDNLSHDNEQQR